MINVSEKRTSCILHRRYRLCNVEIFHIQICRCFQLLWLESKCLTFYTFCSELYRSCLVVWVLLLYCLTSKIISRVLTLYSFIFICIRYIIGKIWEKWPTAMTWLSRVKELIKEYSVYSIDIDTLATIRTMFCTLTLTFDLGN